VAKATESLIPEVIGNPSFPSPKGLKIPKKLMEQILKTSSGRKREPKAVAWFFRFMETGQATQSVLDVGFKNAQPSWKAYTLKQQFADVFPSAVMFQRQMLEAQSVRMHGYVMDVAMDPKYADNPQMLTAGAKSADSILDRGDMPRGAAIKGLDTAPGGEKAVQSAHEMLDRLVEMDGIEAVRLMKGIADYKLYRDYLEEKWPQVLIEVNTDE